MSKVNLKELSEKERTDLMVQLQREEKAKQTVLQKQRKNYEKQRERRIQRGFKGVVRLESQMSSFKEEISKMMAEQHTELDEFGLIPKKSKGGFSIISKDGNFKITRSRDTDSKWDETAIKGVSLIKEFLVKTGQSQVDKVIYELLMGFLAKNDQGDLEFSKVMLFLQHEESFTDPMWKEGLRLLRKGYHVEFKKFGYQFFQKNNEGKFKAISINFSNL